LPIRAVDLPSPPLKIVDRVFAGAAEVEGNPRARSAVMRVAERVAP
jgi:16S rRNA (cytosine1402-N4)-methyltransferase